MMLSVFSKMLTKESDRRVIDNLCGALCRMIMGNVDAVPLEQVRFSSPSLGESRRGSGQTDSASSPFDRWSLLWWNVSRSKRTWWSTRRCSAAWLCSTHTVLPWY